MPHETVWFFDPITCPSCRAPLPAPQPGRLCPRCGVALTSPTGLRLADELRTADRTLAQLRRERVPVATGSFTTTPPRFAPASPFMAPRSAPAPRPNQPSPTVPPIAAPARPRSLAISPAAILLGLGGLCLVVAAIVFLSMSWTALTLGEKVAVLGGVTALLGSAASYVTKKDLRGSAETLWAITYADLALDVFAARRADLLGFRALSLHLFTGLGAGLVALVAVATLLILRQARLIAAQLTVAMAGSTAFIAVLSGNSLPSWFAPASSVLTIAALALTARRVGWTVTAIAAGGIAVLPWLSLVGAGIGQIIESDYAHRLSHGQAWELPLATMLALVAAGVPSLLRIEWLRITAATAGLLTFEMTLIAATDSYLDWAAALAVGLSAAVLISLLSPTVWRTAAMLVSAVLAAVTGPALAVAAAFGVLAGLGNGNGLWRSAADARLPGGSMVHTVALLSLLAAASLAAVRYLPSQRSWLAPIVTVSLVAIGLNAHPVAWLAVAGWLLAAGVVGLLARRPAQLSPGAVAVAFGLLTASPSDVNTGWAFILGALLAVAVSTRLADPALRTLAELTGLGQLLVAVTAVVHTISPQDGTPAMAGLLAVAATSAVTALVSPSRRWWQWLAFAAATGAIWIEAAVRQLHAPELYCVPLGVIVLAFGVREARRRELSSWLTYGPGLLILTAPTTVLALAEPLSWRAWAIGATALALLLAGSRLKLQSPLLIGAFELALLVLREVGPYAMALPRWAGIAAVGVILLGVGITWESRLANVKQVRRQLAELG